MFPPYDGLPERGNAAFPPYDGLPNEGTLCSLLRQTSPLDGETPQSAAVRRRERRGAVAGRYRVFLGRWRGAGYAVSS